MPELHLVLNIWVYEGFMQGQKDINHFPSGAQYFIAISGGCCLH